MKATYRRPEQARKIDAFAFPGIAETSSGRRDEGSRHHFFLAKFQRRHYSTAYRALRLRLTPREIKPISYCGNAEYAIGGVLGNAANHGRNVRRRRRNNSIIIYFLPYFSSTCLFSNNNPSTAIIIKINNAT